MALFFACGGCLLEGDGSEECWWTWSLLGPGEMSRRRPQHFEPTIVVPFALAYKRRFGSLVPFYIHAYLTLPVGTCGPSLLGFCVMPATLIPSCCLLEVCTPSLSDSNWCLF